jgi:DNA-binding NarL/FixJ family response regulator
MNDHLSATITVMIVDDDLMVRETLTEYLATASDLALIGTCASGAEAVEQVPLRRPNVVLMDIRMPVLDGVGATREITAQCPDIKVVMLTTFDEDEVISDAFDAGAAGYLLKNTRAPALIEAVRAARAGLQVVPPGLVSRWSPTLPAANRPRLLPREREVLVLLSRGLTNAEIASELFVSASTVKNHIAALMRKLDADNRTSLTARAHVLGLIPHQ